jgi:hypothetical protein
MEPSFVQTINGKPMQFYRMGGKRPDPNSMDHLVPYMVTTTYAVLCLLLLQLGRKTWPYYTADVATSLACVTLHHFNQLLVIQPGNRLHLLELDTRIARHQRLTLSFRVHTKLEDQRTG